MNKRDNSESADLQGAGALLSGADLCKANLIAADFEVADSTDINLYGANLAGAYRAPVVCYTSTDQLLLAAVVSKKFRQLLLTNPAQAIAEGWGGQKFVLSPKERQRVISIKARTLEEFASQLMANLPQEQ